MLDFFKKKPAAIPQQVYGGYSESQPDREVIDLVEEKVPLHKPKTANEIIQEIHDSYDNACNETISWSKDVIGKCNTDTIQKAERLHKLGFTGTKTAQEGADLLKQKTVAEEKARLIEYYTIHYPNQKFITREQVGVINKKYGLICIEASQYIGDIPEKNLAEIEAFVVKDEDKVYQLLSWDKWGHSTLNFLSKEDAELYSRNAHKKEEPLYISCPKADANIKDGYSAKEDGFVLKDPVEDPIVMQPVKGGFLIISKWGLEGQDASLVNEIMN